MHERTLIIGCSGSGKSWLATKLSDITKQPVVHLDQLYWLENWQKQDQVVFIEKLEKELAKNSWIIDGNFDSTLEKRLKYADFVIFLDFNRYQTLSGAITRAMKYYKRTRPDMTEGCNEKIDFEFLKYIWDYPKTTRQKTVDLLSELKIDSLTFTNRKQMAEWLENMEVRHGRMVHSSKTR